MIVVDTAHGHTKKFQKLLNLENKRTALVQEKQHPKLQNCKNWE